MIQDDIAGADTYALQAAITAYTDEAYTNARKLSGTAIVGSNDQIDVNTETFIGQARWHKPLNPVINVASLTDPTDGDKTSTSTDYQRYIKTVRTHAGEKINLQQVVTQVDGLAKIGRDFAETQAQDEHNAILSVLKGVAVSEVLYGAAAASGAAGLGGQSWDNDPSNKRYGFYVDLGNNKPVVEASAAVQGAARAEGYLRAMGQAWKDYEPDYAYLIATPEIMMSLRSANLVDQDSVTEGNVVFNTIFRGKLRLIQTRANQSLMSSEITKINTGAGVDIVGPKTSFIVLPGAIAMEALSVPTPTEIERKAGAYKGGGTTSIWFRWGYVLMPAGYDWRGNEEKFPSDAEYMHVVEGGTPKGLLSVGSETLADTTGTWGRKTASALSLGILPVFHA
jgi:hypothetical protein